MVTGRVKSTSQIHLHFTTRLPMRWSESITDKFNTAAKKIESRARQKKLHGPVPRGGTASELGIIIAPGFLKTAIAYLC